MKGEGDNSVITQPEVTLNIHVPIFETNVAIHSTIKTRCLKGENAEPVILVSYVQQAKQLQPVAQELLKPVTSHLRENNVSDLMTVMVWESIQAVNHNIKKYEQGFMYYTAFLAILIFLVLSCVYRSSAVVQLLFARNPA